MLSRAIMAPKDLVLDTAEAQRMALFFDHILIWSLSRSELSKEDNQRYATELQYLREQGIILTCGLDIPDIIRFGRSDGTSWSPMEEMKKGCDLLLPFQMGTGVPDQAEDEAHADRLIRHLSSQLVYNEKPVVAHAHATNLATMPNELNSLEITIRNIPMPPENIPWEDLIQFRNEEENIAKLRSLRIWLKERSVANQSPKEIQEELEHLLYEYEKYMKIQHKKFSQGAISTLISSAPDVVASVLTLNFGAAVKSFFDIRGRHLGLTEAELSAPGREVSYIAKVNDFVDP